jgi:hypothetical protein
MGGHANFGPHSHRRKVTASKWFPHRKSSESDGLTIVKRTKTPTGPFEIDFGDIGRNTSIQLSGAPNEILYGIFELRNYLLGLFLVGHIEVTELVAVLLVGNYAEEITQLLLLQVLLGQILEITLGHGNMSLNDNLGLSFLGDSDSGTEVSGLVVNLYSVAEKLLLR